MDITQAILVAAIVVLTTILTLVGYEVFLILREFHRAAQKANKILEDATAISESAKNQINSLSDFFVTAKNAIDLAKAFFQKDEVPLLTEGSKASSPTKEKTNLRTSIKHFFTRSGKRLS